MVPLKRVLCPVDLSELSIRALAYAAGIAEWYRSELTVLHVVPTFEPIEVRAASLFDPVQFVYPMTPEETEAQLRDALRAAGVAPDRARVAARAGEPTEVILNEVLATDADLLVMATRGRRGWDRLMLGSVAEKVLRSAQCPVLTVPPLAGASAEADPSPLARAPRELRRSLAVLCAVDFSPAALQAVEFAVDMANRASASVTLQPLLERALTVEVAAGRAHRQIVHAASEMRADLIVLGAHGRGGPPLAALGSTTDQVVRAAPCPVLTVHPQSDMGSEEDGRHGPGL